MSITLERLEELIPELVKTGRGMRNQTRNGRKFTERELADMISRLLTKTKSVNTTRTRQTAVASGDSRLLEQTEALENLVGNGVLTRMEEFLAGTLEAGGTDDLIDQFNELNSIITDVTEKSPIAISKMIRAQVATLRSQKTSSTRRASAVSNFETVTGNTLTGKELDELVQAIEDGTVNVEELATRMEEFADANDRTAMADEELKESIQDLLRGVESGLIETDQLGTAIQDLLPNLEDTSLSNPDLVSQLTDDPSPDLLRQILEELNDNDIGNIDKEKRKAINMKQDEGFREKIKELTPDKVKEVGRAGKSILVDLLKGGALLALLGSTGLLRQMGGLLMSVGKLALNFIKETVLPKVADLAIEALRIAGEKGGELLSKGLDFASFLLDPLISFGKTLVETLSFAMAKFKSLLPGGGPAPVSSFLEGQAFTASTGQSSIVIDSKGRTQMIDSDGRIVMVGPELAGEYIASGQASDFRNPVSGEGGGSALDTATMLLNRGPIKELNKAIEGPAQRFFEFVLGDPAKKAAESIMEEQVKIMEMSSDSATQEEMKRQEARAARNGSNSMPGAGARRAQRAGSSGGGGGGRSGRVSPPLSSFGVDTQLLNANPGSTLD